MCPRNVSVALLLLALSCCLRDKGAGETDARGAQSGTTPRSTVHPDLHAGQEHEAVAAVLRYARAKAISDVDLDSAKVINSTDEYWDVSLSMPDAVRAGKMPNARLFRVARPGGEVSELGID